MTKINTYRIVRRAYSQFTTIEIITTDWVSAMQICSMMEAYNNDGEYMLRDIGEDDYRKPVDCPVQAAFAFI